jgi:hypothetical protein
METRSMDITTLDLKQHDMTWYKQLLGTKRANKSTTLNISILTPIGSTSFLFLLPAISLPTEAPLDVGEAGGVGNGGPAWLVWSRPD